MQLITTLSTESVDKVVVVAKWRSKLWKAYPINLIGRGFACG